MLIVSACFSQMTSVSQSTTWPFTWYKQLIHNNFLLFSNHTVTFISTEAQPLPTVNHYPIEIFLEIFNRKGHNYKKRTCKLFLPNIAPFLWNNFQISTKMFNKYRICIFCGWYMLADISVDVINEFFQYISCKSW